MAGCFHSSTKMPKIHRLNLIWVIVIWIVQISIPIEFCHPGFAGQIAQIIKTLLKIDIFGFQSLKSLE